MRKKRKKGGERLQKSELLQRVRLSAAAGLLTAALVVVMPMLLLEGPEETGEAELLLPASPAPVESTLPAAESGADGGVLVRVLLENGRVEEQTLADYLWRVVAAEMPASFEVDALRAQAVCARTYTCWKMSGGGGHPEADVCTDSACCQAYAEEADCHARWGEEGALYEDKIRRAVADTDGVVLTYEGQLIQAVFFSSSTAATEDARAVWGSSLPYLVSVDSPEGDEVPNYRTRVELTEEEARQLVLATYPQAAVDGPAEGWFSAVEYTASGRVAGMEIGGVALSGGAVRTLFSLRSACFTVDCRDGAVVFSVVGYGHGVGMSQYGANAMAKAGQGWEEILTHYYTGAAVEKRSGLPG